MGLAELAKRIQTDKGTVSRIERGAAGLDVDRLQKIAAALDVAPAALLAPASVDTRKQKLPRVVRRPGRRSSRQIPDHSR